VASGAPRAYKYRRHIRRPSSRTSEQMRTLVYKRTHVGDPDRYGRFGIHGCMGRVRAWAYDAVIGIGGIGSEPTSHGIDGRVTWIGIGPRKTRGKDPRGPLVTFDKFILFDAKGPFVHDHAPRLAERMYGKHVRVLLHPTPDEAKEIESLLRLAKRRPPPVPVPGLRRVSRCDCGKKHSPTCPNRSSQKKAHRVKPRTSAC
jgi:hypothetical protein